MSGLQLNAELAKKEDLFEEYVLVHVHMNV